MMITFLQIIVFEGGCILVLPYFLGAERFTTASRWSARLPLFFTTIFNCCHE